MQLKNKNVIITGTQRGIGRSMLEEFCSEGANVYAHAREATSDFITETQRLSEKYKVEVLPWCFDLTDTTAMKEKVKELMGNKRSIDALVNNAGVTLNSLFQMTTAEQLRNQMEVNFFSVFLLTQYISKMMVRRKNGSIVNVASTAAIDGNPGKAAYGASKAALITMTQVVAAELGTSGVRANCIAPGITRTDMLETMPEQEVSKSIEFSDLKRAGQPREIAQTAVFLASDLSSYITGQVIRVDGGMGK